MIKSGSFRGKKFLVGDQTSTSSNPTPEDVGLSLEKIREAAALLGEPRFKTIPNTTLGHLGGVPVFESDLVKPAKQK